MPAVFRIVVVLILLLVVVLLPIRKFMQSASEPVRVDPSRAPFTVRDAQGLLKMTLEHADRVCFLVPAMPARRRYQATSRPAPPVAPAGMRRPTLQDLVDAGVAKRDLDFQTRGEEIHTIETISLAPSVAGLYRPGRDNQGQLCFATIKLGKVLSVNPDVAGPNDLTVRYTLEVASLEDWVRNLPGEIGAQAGPWLRQRVVESRMHLCSKVGITTGGATCAGAVIDDEPAHLLPTGPQPDDGLGPWLSPGMRGY